MNSRITQARPARFRFASEDSTRGTDELATLLQSRLRVIAFVIGATMFIFGLLLTVRMGSVDAALAAQMAVGRIIVVAVILPSVAIAWWLRGAMRRPMHLLRRVELVLIAGFTVCIALAMVVDFPSLVSSLPVAPLDLGLSQAAWMSLIIVAYGVMIPNSWKRTVRVIGLMLGATLIVDVWNFTQHSIDASVATTFLIAQWSTLFGFTAFAAFGAYRIEVANEAARDALRLGQYVLVERLGAGGMGEVHRAEHRLLRRPCAVKLIRPEHAGNPEVLRRFEREVQTTATLTHPNTVAIYDYGITADGTFYYVMEYLPGDTLEQLVSRDGPMDPARAIRVLRQVAGALNEAHSAGFTHRDIKPGNVMLGERGGEPDVAKLLDFGLVTTHGADGMNDANNGGITQAGMIVGTPAYMSPEQCAGDEQPGPASDLYSLGALGFFLLTGRSPFEGRASLQMMLAHLHEAPPSARAIRADIPIALDQALRRCLAKQPSDRYKNVREFDQALTDAMA